VTKDENDIMTAAEAASELRLSERVVQNALRDGLLKGRNHAGRKGWTTTRRALIEWIETGNQGGSNEPAKRDDADGDNESF